MMQLPNIHKPTAMTIIVIVIVMFIAYHFLFKKGR